MIRDTHKVHRDFVSWSYYGKESHSVRNTRPFLRRSAIHNFQNLTSVLLVLWHNFITFDKVPIYKTLFSIFLGTVNAFTSSQLRRYKSFQPHFVPCQKLCGLFELGESVEPAVFNRSNSSRTTPTTYIPLELVISSLI